MRSLFEQVLELCANQISDISSLCVRPPLLEHLGLGYNKIMFIGDYITGDYWLVKFHMAIYVC